LTINPCDHIAKPQSLLLSRIASFDLQEALVIDDALASVDATDKVSEQWIVYFVCVAENGSRSGIDFLVVDKRLSASFDVCIEVRCFRARG
jgi:hypothetical protein